MPPNQKINFDLKFGKTRYEYSGAFSGSGTYNGRDFIKFKDNYMILGEVGESIGEETLTNYKLYGFKYWENGICLCEMYPCMSDNNEVGLYDIVRNTFFAVQGNPNPNYESGNIVIPILSTTTRGIHSMRADILCKATNTNKNYYKVKILGTDDVLDGINEFLINKNIANIKHYFKRKEHQIVIDPL